MRRLLLIVLGATLVVACSGGGDGEDQAARSTAAATGTTATTAAATTTTTIAPKREITVLEPGKAPRAELRYRFKAGSDSRQRITYRQQLTQSIDGQEGAPVDVQYSVVLRNVVTAVAADGTADSTVTYEAVEAPPGVTLTDEQRTALQQIAAGLLGVTMSVRTDGRGAVTVTGSSQGAAGMEQATKAAGDLGTLLPVEAVGEGARWTQVASSALAGIALEQSQTFRLAQVKGDRMTLVLEAASQKPLGPPTIPNLPSTAQVEVQAWEVVAADGQTVLDLISGLSEGTSMTKIHQVIAVVDGDKRTALTQDVTLTVTMAPA
ncbi:MAG TPA: hypothetical protein VF855_12945 [Acidimicrobiales bacterium]